MKLLLSTIILLFVSPGIGEATELSGNYKLEITLLNYLDNKPISNYDLKVNNISVRTDSIGIVTTNISWRLPEKVNFNSNKDYKFSLDVFNPKYVMISTSTQYAFIKNKWKKYGFKQWSVTDPSTYKVIVYFWP